MAGSIAFAWLMLAAAGAAAPPAQTVQAAFDAGGQAMAAGRWADAAAIYHGLEAPVSGSRRSLAIVQVREGFALFMQRQPDVARSLLQVGLSGLPSNDLSLAADRADGLRALGLMEEADVDYPAARRDFEASAAAATDDNGRLIANIGIARVAMFDDDAAALAAVDRALAYAASLKATPVDIARLRELRGRVLLNSGQLAAASVEFKAAMKTFGGLTEMADRDDMSIRSDLAIAAMLQHQDDDAHKYLAYTGAGVIAGRETLPAARHLPACGDNGVQPDDVAVVEFGIGDDGSVNGVMPIYASRTGPVAATFASAVAGWSWTPDEVKKVMPFFRAGTRLEMRCTSAGEGASPTVLLRPAFETWIDSVPGADWAPKDASGKTDGVHAAAVARAELARREAAAGPDASSLVPILVALGSNSALPEGDRSIADARALRLANKAGAPTAALVYIALQGNLGLDATPLRGDNHKQWRLALQLLLADPRVKADANALAAVELSEADRLLDGNLLKEARPYLDAVAKDPRLDAQSSLRSAAFLRMATLEQRAGNVDLARTAYKQSGLDAAECALVDLRPSMEHNPFSPAAYPHEAFAWGFGGWSVTEFDVTADGHTRNPRTVLSYPPFVFGPTTVETFKHARFSQSYRPNGEIGCGGYDAVVAFQIE